MQTVEYKDAVATNNFPGTLIPQVKEPHNKNIQGVTFDIHKPIQHNVIIDDITYPITQRSLDKLKKDNRMTTDLENNLKLIREYSDSKSGPIRQFIPPPDPNTKQPISDQPNNSEIIEKPVNTDLDYNALPTYEEEIAPHVIEKMEQSKRLAERQQITKEALIADTSMAVLVEMGLAGSHNKEERPRIKVKFTGKFGSLTVPYNYIHRHGPFLIMLQYNNDACFYEAPQGEDEVTVVLPTATFKCYPGPQFQLSKDGAIMFTVYLIVGE
jgi:hypothetical protein